MTAKKSASKTESKPPEHAEPGEAGPQDATANAELTPFTAMPKSSAPIPNTPGFDYGIDDPRHPERNPRWRKAHPEGAPEDPHGVEAERENTDDLEPGPSPELDEVVEARAQEHIAVDEETDAKKEEAKKDSDDEDDEE